MLTSKWLPSSIVKYQHGQYEDYLKFNFRTATGGHQLEGMVFTQSIQTPISFSLMMSILLQVDVSKILQDELGLYCLLGPVSLNARLNRVNK